MILEHFNAVARCAASSSFYTAPRPMMWADIVAIMKSDRVKNICNRIAQLDHSQSDYKDAKNKLKNQLPIITPHACQFFEDKRSNDAAIWNGLVCVEYDNLNDKELEIVKQFGQSLNNPITGYYSQVGGIEILFLALSASGRGCWLLAKGHNGQYMDAIVHETHQHIISWFKCHDDSYNDDTQTFSATDMDARLDKATDLARCRFLPCYDYVLFDIMEDMDEEEQGKYYAIQISNQYPQFIPWLKEYAITPDMRVEGQRHNAYKTYAIEAAKRCNNQYVILNMLDDLGLPENERQDMVKWAVEHNKTRVEHTRMEQSRVEQQTYTPQITTQIPIDYEALPFPKHEAPKIIQNLVLGLPPCWMQTATLALLPVLSTACGRMTYGQDKPLAFQVAVYGRAGSGKTQFTCAPAQKVMNMLSKNDNDRRRLIESIGKIHPEQCDCPLVLGFDTSTVQLAKYLSYAKQMVMLYTDEISSAVGSDKNAFMQLQPLLRKGYDGTQHIMDFKDVDSFRGAINPKISYLCCGTPTTMFQYFNAKATEQGSTRRTILVEHPICEQEVEPFKLNVQQITLIEDEINWLSMQQGEIYEEDIEQAALSWKQTKQSLAGDDIVKRLMVNTPADTMKRAAYLAYILSHYDNDHMQDHIEFGQWVAEYQLRNYQNITYNDLKKEEQEQKKYESLPTRVEQKRFNEQMLADLPEIFQWEDIIQYRIAHNYPHSSKQMSIITRWRQAGKIAKIKDLQWRKL